MKGIAAGLRIWRWRRLLKKLAPSTILSSLHESTKEGHEEHCPAPRQDSRAIELASGALLSEIPRINSTSRTIKRQSKIMEMNHRLRQIWLPRSSALLPDAMEDNNLLLVYTLQVPTPCFSRSQTASPPRRASARPEATRRALR
jgi:hypothetical protein